MTASKPEAEISEAGPHDLDEILVSDDGDGFNLRVRAIFICVKLILHRKSILGFQVVAETFFL